MTILAWLLVVALAEVLIVVLLIWLTCRRDWAKLMANYRFACDERDAEAKLRRIAYQRLALATGHPSVRHLRSVSE